MYEHKAVQAIDNSSYSTTSRNHQIAYEIINYGNVKNHVLRSGCWGGACGGESHINHRTARALTSVPGAP